MKTLIAGIAINMLLLFAAANSLAHCDSMDGPVIKDAERALAKKDVMPVLKWVPEEHEAEIKHTFEMTLAVRGQNEAAQKVADSYFFDTLVRIHRAGEGEGFTGLKPAGSAQPVIAAIDRALAEGDIDQLAEKISAAVREEIKKRFDEAHEKKKVAENTVPMGREYVEAYVQLTHFIEGIHHLVLHGATHQHRQNEEH